MNSCTTDSGTETLFLDESPCELVGSPPSICSGDEVPRHNDDESAGTRLAPPNIQPYSGVLEEGKMVIKPVAFKPTPPSMTPSTRYGERYGSTPILTRSGSRLTLYGSANDLHKEPHIQNYSLDRKFCSRCTSINSSPPLAISSLPLIPHTQKLLNYDSLESVRESPKSSTDCSLSNKNAYRLSTSNIGSITDLTPSPSDSGVSELEAALRDRDSELAFLRQTMEHNEQVIFRVYQEKEKVWERELHRLKSVHENRLRATAQKASKLEQMLMMQSYQQSQEKKRLMNEVQRVNFQNDNLHQELNDLRSRLEENEWALCQKTGEIALLKNQLKECQVDQTTKCQELLQARTDFRELQQRFEDLEAELRKENMQNAEKTREISDLQLEAENLRCQLKKYQSVDSVDKFRLDDISETEKLKAEIKHLREELSDLAISDYGSILPGRMKPQLNQNDFQNVEDQEDCVSLEDLEIQMLNGEYIECYNEESEAERLRRELKTKIKEFEREKLVWAHEKEKVLRYQRQLQRNYVEIYKRNKALESQLESLALEVAIYKSNAKKEMRN